MTRCTKCNRPLKRETPSGMGEKCERAAYGSRQKRQRAKPVDDRTPDLFEREQDIAATVHALIGSVSLEMSS